MKVSPARFVLSTGASRLRLRQKTTGRKVEIYGKNKDRLTEFLASPLFTGAAAVGLAERTTGFPSRPPRVLNGAASRPSIRELQWGADVSALVEKVASHDQPALEPELQSCQPAARTRFSLDPALTSWLRIRCMKLIPIAYLTSHLLSLLGNSIAAVALPLVVLQVTGSALGAGTVATASAIPAVLAGLLTGVVIDRINRRTSSVVADLISAAAVAALPVVDMVTGLSLGWFVLLGIIGSLGDVPGMTARDALLPAIVRYGAVTAERLMGIREGLGALALLLGPAAAGTLMVLFEGSTVLWITASTSLLAALLTLLIPSRVGALDAADSAADGRNGWTEFRDGWRVLVRSPFLVATTTLSIAMTFVLAPLQALVLPVYFTLMQQPGMLGFVLTALAAGMLVGGGVYAGAGRRVRRRTWFLVGLFGSTLGFSVMATLASIWVVFAGAFVVGVSMGLFGSLMGVLMIERIPDQMRGRIMGTQNAILTATPPAGIVAAALLTEYASVNAAVISIVAVWVIAAAVGIFARSLRSLEPRVQQTANGATEETSDA